MSHNQFLILILVLFLTSGGSAYYGQRGFGFSVGSILVLLLFLKFFGILK